MGQRDFDEKRQFKYYTNVAVIMTIIGYFKGRIS
jgi:hypothetical protein